MMMDIDRKATISTTNRAIIIAVYVVVMMTSSSSSILQRVGRRTSSSSSSFVTAWTKTKTTNTRRQHHQLSHHHHHHHHWLLGGKRQRQQHEIATCSFKLFSSSTVSTSSSLQESSSSSKEEEYENEAIILERFKSISKEIRSHDDLYYNNNQNQNQQQTNLMISDDEFDALVKQEEDLSAKYPQILTKFQQESGLGLAATRSGRVGSSLISSSQQQQQQQRRRKHLYPMLSLDNVHNTEQLKLWIKRIQKNTNTSDNNIITLLTEPKLDGLSLSIRYQKVDEEEGQSSSSSSSNNNNNNNNKKSLLYKLVWASTRGDGKQGQDVTLAVKSMNETIIPDQFWVDGEISSTTDSKIIEIRGEVVMPQSIFDNIDSYFLDGEDDENVNNNNQTTVIKFATARNAASGIIMQKHRMKKSTSKENDDDDDDDGSIQQQKLRSLLQFYAYDVVSPNQPYMFDDGLQARDQLTKWGFQVPNPIAITTLSSSPTTDNNNNNDTSDDDEINDDEIAPMLSYYDNLADYRNNNGTTNNNEYKWGDYEMDGCVHKVINNSLKQILGNSMKSPKWAIAHKFPPQAAVSNLLEISIQVGRTGALTPVAILEPVEVGGVVISRATLHNFIHMKQTLGSTTINIDEDDDSDDSSFSSKTSIPVGTPVLIRRAGDVIPQVVRRVFTSDIDDDTTTTTTKSEAVTNDGEIDSGKKLISLEPPTHCPACNSPVVWDETAATTTRLSSPSNSDDEDNNNNNNNTIRTPIISQVVRCGGPPLLCPPRAVTSLAHAYSRDALDIKGLSEAKIKQLMDAKLLRFPSDIFHFTKEDWNTTTQLPGWGAKSCENLQTTVKDVSIQGVSLGRFIYALGIRHVGKHSSELVASSYGTVGAFLNALETASKWNFTTPTKSEEESEEEEEEEEETSKGGDNAAENGNFRSCPFPELQDTLGIGPVLLNSLQTFSKSEGMIHATKELARGIVVVEQPVVAAVSSSSTGSSVEDDETKGPWEGFRVVFTGTMPGDMSRTEAQDVAKTVLGAKSTPGSISKSTDLLVYGEKVGKKKLEQAKEFGIQTMPAAEFVELLEEHAS